MSGLVRKEEEEVYIIKSCFLLDQEKLKVMIEEIAAVTKINKNEIISSINQILSYEKIPLNINLRIPKNIEIDNIFCKTKLKKSYLKFLPSSTIKRRF